MSKIRKEKKRVKSIWDYSLSNFVDPNPKEKKEKKIPSSRDSLEVRLCVQIEIHRRGFWIKLFETLTLTINIMY